MHSILLFHPDDRPFDVAMINRIFQSESGFRDVRFNEPGGALIEADYVEPNGRTIVGLSGNQRTISLRGTSDVALRATLILQSNLKTPLRIVDTDYSFDLIIQDYPDIDTLRAAIANAQAD